MRRRFSGFLLAAFCSSATVAAAGTIALDRTDALGIPIGSGESLLLDGSGNLTNELTRTGVYITNNWSETGEVTVQFVEGAPLQKGDQVAPGFALLDGTLVVHSSIPVGEQRVRVRMGYRRADLRRVGLRAGSVRLMRRALGRRAVRWLPAVQAATGRAGIRFARTSPLRAPGRVGNYGFDGERAFVWAILDRNSAYAVGARLVPEPASLGLFAAGLGALFLSARYRRDS